MSWIETIVLVLTFIGLGIGALSVPPQPLLLFARGCFIVAAIVVVGKFLWWSITIDNQFWLRIAMIGFVSAISSISLSESLRWVNDKGKVMQKIDDDKISGQGGKGGNATAIGNHSVALGGPAGGGGPGGKGGDGGSAIVSGDYGFAMGGEGGEAGQVDRGGRGGRSPAEILGLPKWMWQYGRGGDGASPAPKDNAASKPKDDQTPQ